MNGQGSKNGQTFTTFQQRAKFLECNTKKNYIDLYLKNRIDRQLLLYRRIKKDLENMISFNKLTYCSNLMSRCYHLKYEREDLQELAQQNSALIYDKSCANNAQTSAATTTGTRNDIRTL